MDHFSASDEQLAGLAQAGELAAFEELVSRHEQRIFRFAFQICRTEHGAAEVTQDTFVRAFQAIGQYDPAFAFRSWLFGIARNKALDHCNRSRVPIEPPLPEEVSEDNPAEALVRSETATEVWRVAREKLSPDAFQALWLRYAEDLEVQEVARALRKSKTHVKVMLFRARRVLAQELKRTEKPALEPRFAAAPTVPLVPTRL